MEIPSKIAVSVALGTDFDMASVSRGRALADGGEIYIHKVTPSAKGWGIDGFVVGTSGSRYLTKVDLCDTDLGYEITGDCSCPVAEQCKHAVALLLRWIKESERSPTRQPDFFESTGSDAAKPPPQAPPGRPIGRSLDKKLAKWLSLLEADLVEAKPSAAATPLVRTGRLGFQLTLEKTRISVTSYYGASAAGLGQFFQIYDLTAFHRGQIGGLSFSDEDKALVKELALIPSASSYGYSHGGLGLSDSEGAQLLGAMIATGNCAVGVPPNGRNGLKLGLPRKAEPGWKADSRGIQRAEIVVTPGPAMLIPVDPPWYLDAAANECGRLELSIPAKAARRWLQAPPVKPDQSDLLSARLARKKSSAALPPPAAVEIEVVRNLEPVPCLKVLTASVEMTPIASYYGYKYEKIDILETSLGILSFDYDGEIIPAETTGDTFQVPAPGKLVVVERSMEFEMRAADRLRQAGLSWMSMLLHDQRIETHGKNWMSDDGHGGWYEFMTRHLPGLVREGWRIEIDPSFGDQPLTVEDYYTDGDAAAGNAWFDLELGVLIKGERVNLLPVLLKIISSENLTPEALAALDDTAELRIRLPEGGVMGLPVARIRQLLGVVLELFNPAALDDEGRLRLPKLRVAELLGETNWKWHGQEEMKQLAARLRDFQGIRKVEKPAGLMGELRPYQADGVSWLQFLRDFELGGVLADDMGLGKTVQTLAHLLVEKESGRMDRPSLIVAPTSLMTNWRREAEKFAPSLRVLVLHGLDRKADFGRIADHDIIVTSYPLLPRDQEQHLAREYHYVILDEAQFIKNAKTTYAQTACLLKARHRLCLTGTPMENHLGELWSICNFLLPGFLGDETRFNAMFRRPIEKGGHDERRKLLARRVAPFLLRRRKADVIKELPPKTEIVQDIELSGGQRDLYETVRLAMQQKVREEIQKKGMSRSHIIILDALLKLRQICCDPRLLKLPSAKKVKESAKLEMLMDMLPEMIAEGRRILVFSQFTSMLALIEEALTAKKISYVMLTGDTTDRATPVDRFQKGEVPVFLLSLKAGGTGLNLTAADTVIHYDPWWNPAVENQATDRAHRIGQSKNVFVYKFMTVGTVEEKIGQMQARKRDLVEGLFSENGKQGVQLTSEDLDVLFAPLK